jgi:hypothetical protein
MENKLTPTKSERGVRFKKGSDKDPYRVKFPEGRRCDARYMIHLKFLYNLVFKPPTGPTDDITNENCPHPDKKYQVFENGEYKCVEMPNRNDPEQLLRICKHLYKFLNFIIKEMLRVPSGHNFKSLQDNIRKLIAIRTNVINKIKSIIDTRGTVNISESSFYKDDTIGYKFTTKLTQKIQDTVELSRDTDNRYPPSAAATEADVKCYLLTLPTIPGYEPTDLSDDDMDGGSFIKKYKRKSKKKRSFKKKTIKNKSNRK